MIQEQQKQIESNHLSIKTNPIYDHQNKKDSEMYPGLKNVSKQNVIEMYNYLKEQKHRIKDKRFHDFLKDKKWENRLQNEKWEKINETMHDMASKNFKGDYGQGWDKAFEDQEQKTKLKTEKKSIDDAYNTIIEHKNVDKELMRHLNHLEN